MHPPGCTDTIVIFENFENFAALGNFRNFKRIQVAKNLQPYATFAGTEFPP